MKIYSYIAFFSLLVSVSNKSLAQYEKFIKLEESYSNAKNIDSLKYILVEHYSLAVSRKDTLEQFKVLAWVYWYNSDVSKDATYRDSLIRLAELLKSPIKRSQVYYTIASKHQEKGEFADSAKNLEKSIQIALENKNYEQALESITALSVILNGPEQLEKVISHLSNLSWHISTSLSSNEVNKTRLLNKVWIDKTNLFLNFGVLDSSSYYSELISKNTNLLDHSDLGKFKLTQATLNYKLQHYLNAKDSLIKYMPSFGSIQIRDAWYVLSLIEKKLGNSDNSDLYLKQIDSALESEEYPMYPNGVSTYRRLLSIAPDSLKNKYLGLFYHYEKLQNPIINEVVNNEEQAPVYSNYFVLFFGSILILALTLYFFYIRPLKKKKKVKSSQFNADHSSFKFIESLKEWEEKKEFIDSGTTLASLATLLGTNTTYLSKYFNQELQTSFSNYLSKLRINHLLELIMENPSIIKSKSSIQIAESLGFKSIDAYSRAFKITTGTTPNQYLKKVLTNG